MIFNVDADPVVMRGMILSAVERLLSAPGEKMDFPVEHFLCDGTYTRRLFIPKGAILFGKIHRKACVNIVAAGDITVMTETGAKRIQAGYTVVTPAGLLKVGYAHEDTVFINVFRTDETDIEKIEAEIACTSYEALAAPSVNELGALCQ